MKVTMFVKNSFEYDARVTKEAKALVGAGHEVAVVALLVPGVTPAEETTADGVHVVRVRQLDFLLGSVNRLLAARAERREVRRAARTGTHPDVERARQLSTLRTGATATPGAVAWSAGEPGDGARSVPATVRVGQRAFRAVVRIAGPGARLARAAYVNRGMVNAARGIRADLHHAHDLNTLWVATRAASDTGARVVYDAHEMHSARAGAGPVRRAWSAWWERRLLKQVDEAITVSTSIAEHMKSIPTAPTVTVVRNIPETVAVGIPLDLRAELGLPAEVRIVVYQGTIQRHRGIEELIEAVQQLERCALVVIGHGDHRSVLETRVAREGLADVVRFFGPVDNRELIRWTASADVGTACIRAASLSYYYALPNKLFEYMMAGIPVVASDFPDMAEVVRGFDVGQVCDPDDPASIAAALAAVLDEPGAAGRYRGNARRAAASCCWEAEQRILLDVYNRLGSAEPHPVNRVKGSNVRRG